MWLVLGGVAYVALSLTSVLLPKYQSTVYAMGRPLRLGELVFMVWLVIVGARSQALQSVEDRNSRHDYV